MTVENEVKQTSDEFYAALNRMLASGDAATVTAIWSRGQAASTMHPIGGREVGREQVLASWEQAAPAFVDGRCSADDVVVVPLGDDVAYTVGTERFEGKVGGETFSGEWRGPKHLPARGGGGGGWSPSNRCSGGGVE